MERKGKYDEQPGATLAKVEGLRDRGWLRQIRRDHG
jgi:hypothetical protein